jgi:hypothetical protein
MDKEENTKHEPDLEEILASLEENVEKKEEGRFIKMKGLTKSF